MYWIVLILILLPSILYILYENKNPILENVKIKDKKFKSSIKIIHISDLHNARFGKNQNKLIKLIDSSNADICFITGDLIDRRNTDIDVAMELINQINIPMFFIRGNHEKALNEKYILLKNRLKEKNVHILENSTEEFSHKGFFFNIIGLDDPRKYKDNKKVSVFEEYEIDNTLKRLLLEANRDYVMLLSHRPEYFEIYAENYVNIVFSGHTHGGYVRLFNRGLFSADQGFFGKYAGGVFKNLDTCMINSRGLGNNFWFAKRVFNRPHILEVEIN